LVIDGYSFTTSEYPELVDRKKLFSEFTRLMEVARAIVLEKTEHYNNALFKGNFKSLGDDLITRKISRIRSTFESPEIRSLDILVNRVERGYEDPVIIDLARPTEEFVDDFRNTMMDTAAYCIQAIIFMNEYIEELHKIGKI
jgi:hypothetical protein